MRFSSSQAFKISIYILSAIGISIISGCGNKNDVISEEGTKNNSVIYSSMIKKRSPTIAINEYISRVGKKLLLVNSDPEVHVNFNVSSNYKGVEIKSNTININTDVLQSIDDEASLAYILAAGIEKITNNGQLSEFDQDKEIIHNMERAGYDPRTIVEIQNKYLQLFSGSEYSWVKQLSEHRIDSSRINKNNNYISKGFKGLKRYKDRYNNIVKPS